MYHSVLVPLDGSALAESALPVASALAEGLPAQLRLVHVYRLTVVDELARYGVAGEAARSIAEHYVLGIADRLRAGGMTNVSATVVDGHPAEAIAAHAVETRTDLIVMASHGRTGVSRFWLGSVADGVVRSANTPVLMVRGRAAPTERPTAPLFARILVPLDGSVTAEAIVPHAITIAKLGGSKVHLLRVEEPAESLRTSVWVLAQEPDDLADRLTRADHDLHTLIDRFESDWAPTKPTAEARAGHRSGDTIVAVASEREADLIAMTTHGRGASRMMVGSVADKVLRGTQCSVLLVRSR